MITKNDIDCLMRQMRAALVNKPISAEMLSSCEELLELQQAIEYMSSCLTENHQFLTNLCAGQLNADVPGRHNFLAGQLKELHSILKHLTWQTAQVANGDYSQQVRFLGEFSDSFNIMIHQLKEREINLSAKSHALSQSTNLLKAVIDGQRDWILIIDELDKNVIYANLSAKRKFYSEQRKSTLSPDYQELFELLCNSELRDERWEFACEKANKLLQVRSFPVEWNERQALVHCIADITDEHEEKEQLQSMAYNDTLTGAYNRRYCIEKINALLYEGTRFALVLLDLDGLKIVNDSIGHNFGDDYITTVASTVIDISRANDRLCRIGGDEFVLILPHCTEANATKKMAHACALLAQHEREYEMAISYGIISVKATSDATADELFSLADAKMYAMKKEHRDNARKMQ